MWTQFADAKSKTNTNGFYSCFSFGHIDAKLGLGLNLFIFSSRQALKAKADHCKQAVNVPPHWTCSIIIRLRCRRHVRELCGLCVCVCVCERERETEREREREKEGKMLFSTTLKALMFSLALCQWRLVPGLCVCCVLCALYHHSGPSLSEK